MQRHQRRRTRRVDTDGRTFQAQHIGDTPRRHTVRAAGGSVSLHVPGRAGRRLEVVLDDAGVDPDVTAVQRGRVDPGPLQRLPRGLQQQPLLRIHRQRLTRTDPEEPGVKARRIGQEATDTDRRLPCGIRIRAEQALQIPTPVGGELPHRIRARGQQLPERGRAVDTTGQPQPHTHDRHRFVHVARCRDGRGYGDGARQLRAQEVGQRRRGRIVEHQGRR